VQALEAFKLDFVSGLPQQKNEELGSGISAFQMAKEI
jgi:hypothetical protein